MPACGRTIRKELRTIWMPKHGLPSADIPKVIGEEEKVANCKDNGDSDACHCEIGALLPDRKEGIDHLNSSLG